MSQSTLDGNPFAIAVRGGGGLPASRSVARSFERGTALTREEQYIARELRSQVSTMDAWTVKGCFAAGEIGRVNVFAATTFQGTLQGMSAASRLPGCSPALQDIMGQFVEVQAINAGKQLMELSNLAVAAIFREFARPLYPEELPPEEPGLLRRLLGGG